MASETTVTQASPIDSAENLSVICSHAADPDLVEAAAALLRTNMRLRFVEMQDLDGGKILAWRGDHPGGERFAL